MNQPLFSIIITVLNGEKTIGACLSSIHNQSFTDYEVVIVDGGSTDRTVDVVKSSLVTRKTLHVESGLGLYAGLNTGVRLAQGKWFYFIGCDDELYSPQTLQSVANILTGDNNGAQVLVGNVECVKQESLLRHKFGSPVWMQYRVHHQGMFYDRSLFDQMLYNENMRIASDYEFNLRLALDNVSHQAIDLIICNFGGDGISENQAKQGFKEMQSVHRRLFGGVDRPAALACYWLQQRVIIIRKRLGLLNLKVRLKRLLSRWPSLSQSVTHPKL